MRGHRAGRIIFTIIERTKYDGGSEKCVKLCVYSESVCDILIRFAATTYILFFNLFLSNFRFSCACIFNEASTHELFKTTYGTKYR